MARKQPFEGTGFFRPSTIRGKRSLLFIPHGKESFDYKGKLLEIVLRADLSEWKVQQLADDLNQIVQAVDVSDLARRSGIRQHKG